ncbi:MAG: T9SS type A sorting domain-containing protein [Bacteroidales bacterium]|jgi:hypothetical protein|nr:T9SS type A sorting domain-containing protein [Bacteroidales bacterium]
MKRLTLLVTFVLFACNLFSQRVLSSSGGTGTFDDFSVNWSIGEVVTETFSIGGIIVNQGFNQYAETVKDITTVDGYETINAIAYPNPTTNYVYIKVSDIELTGLSYMLTTLEGMPIIQEPINSEETAVDLLTLSPSLYLLSILKEGIVVRSFRIVKIE